MMGEITSKATPDPLTLMLTLPWQVAQQALDQLLTVSPAPITDPKGATHEHRNDATEPCRNGPRVGRR